MTDRSYQGRIAYLAGGEETGRETFSVSVRNFGRTVRSYCEIDNMRLVRDASWSLDRDWRPLEGHVRVLLGDRLAGSSWYRFDRDGVDCEAITADAGRVSQRLAGDVAYLGLHPLVGDGLVAAARGIDAPGETRIVRGVSCSTSENGETGLTALPVDIGVTYIGEETVDVIAGRFVSHHFQLQWQPHWPAADLWVHGPDFVFVKMIWSFVPTRYELAAFSEAAG